ncbi:hypothetical protein [Acidithiobacillus sp.]|uniref:hypothetical protein n=1 Tax=Acidithiobacillus sp. TaxID=1872118 RepID=UPI00230C1F92|nr:hypothetical protein [Acidithiobacillus sp.]MDA8247263.1 hypothetical protein [Acidithiobacillus sp.]
MTIGVRFELIRIVWSQWQRFKPRLESQQQTASKNYVTAEVNPLFRDHDLLGARGVPLRHQSPILKT